MNGNGFNGWANGQGYATGMGNTQGMQYAQMRNIQPLMTNPLTAEEEKLLITEQDTFDLKVQPKEIAEAVCTHKKDGRFQITPLGNNGECICNLCKAKFNPAEVTEIYTQEAVDAILNVLQTCKMIGVDMNNDVVRQFYTIIPYIKRIPKLYSMLVRIFEKYNMQNPVAQASGPNVFNMFNSIMNPAIPIMAPQMDPNMMYGGYPYNMMQQNMVNGGVGTSPLYQQPQMMQPPYNNVYPQQQNPAMMNQPTFGQPPMQQPQMPNQQQAPVQPNVQQNQQPQQQTGQVNVKEQLQL